MIHSPNSIKQKYSGEQNRNYGKGFSMANTRQHKRYQTHREAHYFLHHTQERGRQCTIINVSRKGMGIIFHTDETLHPGETIRLEVPVRTAFESISVSGMVKWVDKIDSDFIGGIELTKELNDVKFSKLC